MTSGGGDAAVEGDEEVLVVEQPGDRVGEAFARGAVVVDDERAGGGVAQPSFRFGQLRAEALHRVLRGHTALYLCGDRVLELADLVVHGRHPAFELGGLAGVPAGEQRGDRGGTRGQQGELPAAGHGSRQSRRESDHADSRCHVHALFIHPLSIGCTVPRIKPAES